MELTFSESSINNPRHLRQGNPGNVLSCILHTQFTIPMTHSFEKYRFELFLILVFYCILSFLI